MSKAQSSTSQRTPQVARITVGLVLLTVGLSGSAFGATFPELYSIIVPREATGIAQSRPRTQDETIRLAMGQLLTRVTGRRDARFEPQLNEMLRLAGDFVEQIGQLDRDNLIVRFNASNVESALVRLEQPVWGSERPLTMLWVAVDAGLGQRELLAAEPLTAAPQSELETMLANFRADLVEVADERGLLLTLPLVDIEDMTALSFADVWGGFSDRVVRASERYGTDDILIAQVRLTDFGAVTRWTLLRGGRELRLPGQAFRDGLDALADVYAAEFSTLGSASSTAVTIVGVETLDDYGRVMQYLESLSVLENVEPEELVAGSLRVRVAARGGEFALRRVLELGELLQPAAGDELTYSLAP
ncbi:MAG: DUF2066 domain-containing protein [Gammaproteobacteria bacterium]|nr:DUF2066 domain-containing protein [Gammaproteobacteria bacterium]